MTTGAGLERHIDAKANTSWVTFRAIVETAGPIVRNPSPTRHDTDPPRAGDPTSHDHEHLTVRSVVPIAATLVLGR